jgi:hypothetical protein
MKIIRMLGCVMTRFLTRLADGLPFPPGRSTACTPLKKEEVHMLGRVKCITDKVSLPREAETRPVESKSPLLRDNAHCFPSPS